METGTAVAPAGTAEQVTVVPAAVEVVPAVVETVTPKPAEVTPPGPRSRREFRQSTRDMSKEYGEKFEAEKAPIVDAQGKVHHPNDGRYISPVVDGAPALEAGAAVVEGGTPPAGTPDGAKVTETPAAPLAPQGIRVDIPIDHPISNGKPDAIAVSSPEDARKVRAILNGTHVRRSENVALKSMLDETQARLRTEQNKRIEQESLQIATERWHNTPEYQAAVQKYGEIRDTIGQDEATVYWDGVKNRLKPLIEQERTTRIEEARTAEAERSGVQWVQETWGGLSERVHETIRAMPELQHWFQEEVELFNHRLGLGHFAELKTREQADAKFNEFMNARIKREPKVRAAYAAADRASKAKAQETTAAAERDRQAREIEAAKDKGAQEFKEKVATKRAGMPQNPLAAATHVATPTRPSGTPDTPDTSELTGQQLKKHLRKEAAGLAGKYFP